MPLTLDEQDKLFAVEVERLIFEITNAVKDHDVAAFQTARDKLQDLCTNPDAPYEIRVQASEAHAHASINMSQAGIAQMAAIADAVSSAGSGLRNAIRVAETGKEELFFPSLAAAAARAEETFEQFKAAADQLEAALQAAGHDSVKSRIEAVATAAKALKDALPT